MSRGCPEFLSAGGLSRRRMLAAGSSRSRRTGTAVTLEGRAEFRSRRSCQAHHPAASVRRTLAHRHVRHEARCARGNSRRVQTDRDRPARSFGSRAPAAVRDGRRSLCAGALGEPPNEEPQFGDLLQPDRPRAAARRHPPARHPGALPRLRQHRRQAEAGRGSVGADIRLLPLCSSRRQRDARPARELSGQSVRPVFHRARTRTNRNSVCPS